MITAADPQTLPAGPGYLLIVGLACTAAGALCFLGFLATATCDLIRHHRERRTIVPTTHWRTRAATTGAVLLAAAGTVSAVHHLHLAAALFGAGVLVLAEAALREHRRARRRAAAHALAAAARAARARQAADEAFAAGLSQRLDDVAADLTQHLHAGGMPADVRLGWERD